MDIFTKRANCMKESQRAFNRLAFNVNEGLEMPKSFKLNLEKLGSELLEPNDVERISKIRCIYYSNLLTNKLSDFSYFEWLVCLEEKVLLEYTIPLFSRVLFKYPFLYGLSYCKGEVICKILELGDTFWIYHSDWKNVYRKIVKNIFELYSEDELNSILKREYVKILKLF